LPEDASESAGREHRALAALLLLFALAAPALAGEIEPAAVVRVASELAERVAREAGAPEPVALQVAAPGADALAGPLAAAISEALSRRGFAVALFAASSGPGAEEAARILGADRLLRVVAGLVPGRRELVVSAESVPTRPSFFLQRVPEYRAGAARLLDFSVPADETTLLLARAGSRAGSTGPALFVRPLFQVEERVLAVGAGVAGADGIASLALVSERSVSVVSLGGVVRARYALDPDVRGPRRPAATAAVGSLGAGRVAIGRAGAGGLLLAMEAGALLPAGSFPAVPLAAGERGALFGAYVPGKAVLADALSLSPDPAPRPRSEREFVSFAAAPRPGRVAFAWVSGDGVATLLGPDLEPVGPPLEGVGAGLALADLYGDGEPEVVASAPDAGATDRVRVLRWPAGAGPEAPPVVVLESAALPGSIQCGASADLTGDGLDDVVVAAALPEGGSQLWLVTSDLRFAEAR